MNRLPEELVLKAEKLLEAGHPVDNVARKLGINRGTARRILRFSGIKHVEKASSERYRDRRGYHHKYYHEKAHMNQSQRRARNEKARACIAEILAKAERPLLPEEVLKALLPRFPDFTLGGLRTMLGLNAEGVFKKMGSYWTYEPPEIWVPILNNRRPEFDRARAFWLDKHGIQDPVAQAATEAVLLSQKYRVANRRAEIGAKAGERLSAMQNLMETAKAITKHASSTRNS